MANKVIPFARQPATAEIKQRLLEQLSDVLRYLLPNGVFRQGKFYVGDVNGKRGQSLVVEINGSKTGLWKDFATDDGGDIISLWAAVKGFNVGGQFPELMADIKQWLNMPTIPYVPPKNHKPPTITKKLGKPTGRWDYTDEHGVLLASVYRFDPPHQKKQYRPWDVVKGCMKAPDIRPLYNQAGMVGVDKILLVEGEKCAEALIKYGICATTAMNGAKAPVEKIDWSPLKNKHVIIWPDNDEPGIAYAKKAASAAAKAGAKSVEIIQIPESKPEKWDAADAVEEGLNITDFLQIAKCTPFLEDRASLAKKALSVKAYRFGDLLADNSPMPEDLISPRLLTPAGMLVFGGAPKVGKSDFIISLLAHMAGGVEFLLFKPPRPLRVFYLQAEVQYHYLRERIKHINLPEHAMDLVNDNLVVTPQTSLIFDDAGIAALVKAVKQAFPNEPPDILAIDPIRNVFNGGGLGGENDNDAMMFFLNNRVVALRDAINPNMGVILTHHTRKMGKKQVEEDPFQAFSGASSLRSFYTSGMLMYRSDEAFPERTLVFELRNGPAIKTTLVDKSGGKWLELGPQSERLAMRSQGHKLDAERLRKQDVILHNVFEESLKGRVYTANQFAEKFESKSGLGSNRGIRERINVLATKGYVKFFKSNPKYGINGVRGTRHGYLCVEGMGFNTPNQPLYPTHFKCPHTGEILPIDEPQNWIYYDKEDASC